MRKYNMTKNVTTVIETVQDVAVAKEAPFKVVNMGLDENSADIEFNLGDDKNITLNLVRVPKSTVTNFKVEGEDMAFPLTTMATFKAYTEQVITKFLA